MEGIDELLRGMLHGYLKRGHPAPAHPHLTIGQIHCLRLIARLGMPTMSELSEALQLQPSTVTGLVDALIEHGLAERRDDPEDRRIVRVALTAEGKRGREQHRRMMRRRLMKVLGDIDDQGLHKIHDALTILHDAATRAARDHS